MSNRCSSCNKFTALEFQEPEEQSFDEDLQLTEDEGTVVGSVSANIRIFRNSECCGEEMKEATLEISEEVTIEHDKLEDHLVKKENGSWAWRVASCPSATMTQSKSKKAEDAMRRPTSGRASLIR